jgi:hypothetical protein
VSLGLVAVVAGALALQFVPASFSRRFETAFTELPLSVQGATLGAFIALTFILGPTGVAPFIYYQF